jgi:hypothetical protein
MATENRHVELEIDWPATAPGGLKKVSWKYQYASTLQSELRYSMH